mmetsp:Transcript_93687/g.260824  ORF Transcript_93687/g.260824 Transcript_93687/m.260824 type:complete len:203 (-) Transcript_93687:2036-2644(-)
MMLFSAGMGKMAWILTLRCVWPLLKVTRARSRPSNRPEMKSIIRWRTSLRSASVSAITVRTRQSVPGYEEPRAVNATNAPVVRCNSAIPAPRRPMIAAANPLGARSFSAVGARDNSEGPAARSVTRGQSVPLQGSSEPEGFEAESVGSLLTPAMSCLTSSCLTFFARGRPSKRSSTWMRTLSPTLSPASCDLLRKTSCPVRR